MVQRSLSKTSKELQSVSERLSSGLRINRGSDDAAGLSVAANLNVNKRVFNQGVRNLNDGLSMLAIAEGAVGQLSNIVIRQTELAEQAANGIFSQSQRGALDLEAQRLFDEYQRILNTTEFNGLNLLDGTAPSIDLQAGYGESGTLEADILENSVQTVNQTVGLGTYTNNVIPFGTNPATDGPGFIVADFDLDGIDDIVAIKNTDLGGGTLRTSVAFFLGNSTGTGYTAIEQQSFDTNYSGILLGSNVTAEVIDRGGDGDMDVVVNVFAGGSLSIGQRNGAILNNQIPSGSFSMNAFVENGLLAANQLSATQTGDFNNDGIDDLIQTSGPNANIRIQDTTTNIVESLVVETLDQTAFSLTSQFAARNALDSLDEDLVRINSVIARIGATQSKISTAGAVLSTTVENTAAAESRIVDADVARESAQLVKLNLLQQASASILAQANLQPQLALNLIQNAI